MNRRMEQQREPRSRSTFIQLFVFDKGNKAIQRRKKCIFSKCCWNNWLVTQKKTMTSNRYPILKPLPYTIHKNKFEMGKDRSEPQRNTQNTPPPQTAASCLSSPAQVMSHTYPHLVLELPSDFRESTFQRFTITHELQPFWRPQANFRFVSR